jgi:hypothetical protein
MWDWFRSLYKGACASVPQTLTPAGAPFKRKQQLSAGSSAPSASASDATKQRDQQTGPEDVAFGSPMPTAAESPVPRTCEPTAGGVDPAMPFPAMPGTPGSTTATAGTPKSAPATPRTSDTATPAPGAADGGAAACATPSGGDGGAAPGASRAGVCCTPASGPAGDHREASAPPRTGTSGTSHASGVSTGRFLIEGGKVRARPRPLSFAPQVWPAEAGGGQV